MPTNIFQDEAGNYSISRVLPFVAFVAVLLLTAYVSLRRGALAPIPDSWLTLIGMSFGTYASAKALMLKVGRVDPTAPKLQTIAGLVAPLREVATAAQQEVTDGNA